mgnify:FL=1
MEKVNYHLSKFFYYLLTLWAYEMRVMAQMNNAYILSDNLQRLKFSFVDVFFRK